MLKENFTNMVVTLAQCLSFLENKGKCLKEVKIITSMGMLRAAAEQTELIASVRDCC